MQEKGHIDLLEQIRQNQKALYWQGTQEQQNTKDSLIGAIKAYLSDNSITLGNYSPDELAEKLYNDLAADYVLTVPLNDICVESIWIES